MSGPPDVRVFDAAGSYLKTICREGDGPGEFRRIAGLWVVLPDTLIVYDVEQSRITVFDVEGSVVRTTFFNPGVDSPGLAAVIVVGRFSDGTYLARPNAYLRNAEGRSGRTLLAAERRRADGTVVDTISVLPDIDFATCDGGDHCPPIFGKRAVFLAHGDSYYTGMADDYSIDEYSVQGRLIRRIRLATVAVRVTEEMRTQFIEAQVLRLRRYSSEARIRQRLEDRPVAEMLPAFDRPFILDKAGNLWVKNYQLPSEAVVSFRVFDTVGRFLGEVDMPPTFTPHVIGADHVTGVCRDSLDVESVVRFELVKPSTRIQ
jgi:hypothetical protein